MLEIVAQPDQKRDAQRRFRAAVNAALPAYGKHKVGFPGPGKTLEHRIRSTGPGSLYYAYSEPVDDDVTPRHWNSFGIFRLDRSVQHIVVEINIPTQANGGRVSGFFARDPLTNQLFVMHDGGLRGGSKGVGKKAFLEYLAREPEPVRVGNKTRLALRISAIDDPNIAALIWEFVQQVDEFKRAAKAGTLGSNKPVGGADTFTSYFDEFWGRKRGSRRSKRIDYTSYHGLIVKALNRDREKSLLAGQRIVKNRLIDLGVCQGEQLCEVYEVKSAIGRQTLYTAVGQLMTHGWQSGVAKVLVIPDEVELAKDAKAVLKHLGIGIRRFVIKGRGISAKVALLGKS